MDLELSIASNRHLTTPAPEQLQPRPWLCHRAVLDLSPEALRGLTPLALGHIKQPLFPFYLPFYAETIGNREKVQFLPGLTGLVSSGPNLDCTIWCLECCSLLITVPQEPWAHSFRDLCPLRSFSCLLFLMVPAWSLLRIRNRVIYPGAAQPNAQASSRAWQNWNLKIALRWSALFPC